MQLGMIGLGRMGGSMVQRLLRGGHACVVFDSQSARVTSLAHDGATGSHSLDEFVRALDTPRVVWLMVPAGAVDTTLNALSPHLQPGDVVVDGGNSHYVDDIRRAKTLESRGVHYVDAGVSGGVWGVERGYCLMIGGTSTAVTRLDPLFKTLAPGFGVAARTPGRDPMNSTADEGYLHCGPAGAGHFVKMVHNAIEYALMAAYAEGFNILAHANVGVRTPPVDAETAPLRHPEHYRYDFALPDVASVAPWKRHWFMAPRSHSGGAGQRAGPARVFQPGVRFRGRSLGSLCRHRERHSSACLDGRALPKVQLARRRLFS